MKKYTLFCKTIPRIDLTKISIEIFFYFYSIIFINILEFNSRCYFSQYEIFIFHFFLFRGYNSINSRFKEERDAVPSLATASSDSMLSGNEFIPT